MRMNGLDRVKRRLLGLVPALAVAWLMAAAPPRASADCDSDLAPRVAYSAARSAIEVEVVPQLGGTHDVVVRNVTKAWYSLQAVTPSVGSCWSAAELAPTRSGWAPGWPKLIKPGGTVTVHGLYLFSGDRLGVCYVGFPGPVPADLATARNWVGMMIFADVASLMIFGDRADVIVDDVLAKLKAHFVYGALGPIMVDLRRIMDELGNGLQWTEEGDTLVDLLEKIKDNRERLYDLGLVTTGVTRSRAAWNVAFHAVGRLVAIVKAAKLAVYLWEHFKAYVTSPYGHVRIDVGWGPAVHRPPPRGTIVEPPSGATVGNLIDVRGTAFAPCSAIVRVDLEWAVGQGPFTTVQAALTSDWEVDNLSLAAVPDGSTVRLRWKIRDSNGTVVSPADEITVIKNAGSLAPPAESATYVADVTVPDGTVFTPGATFAKTWRVRNIGRIGWNNGYQLFYAPAADAVNLAAVASVPLPALVAGAEGDITIAMTAPTTPGRYRSTWRFRNPGGVVFGGAVTVVIDVACELPGCGACAANDRCLNMGCSTHGPPGDDTRYKTPGTGAAVFYARASYSHVYPDSACYHLLHDDFSGVSCISNDFAATMTPVAGECADGSFYRVTGQAAIYRLEAGHLRPLCGDWTSATFGSRFNGYPFQVATLTDAPHFAQLAAAYPILPASGIFPPDYDPPVCGDPGYQCGDHPSADLPICAGALSCGACSNGLTCVDGNCVGLLARAVPGAIASPAAGSSPASPSFQVTWTPGHATDGSPTSTALLCRVNSLQWQGYQGFGTVTTAIVANLVPGDVVSCKTRTRLDSSWDEWADGDPVSWTVSDAYAAMEVVSVAPRADSHPNGCDDLIVTASIRNVGDLGGTWAARAYLHPALEDETSPAAVASREIASVVLAPGQARDYVFTIDTAEPLPLAASGWTVTVVVDDPLGLGATRRLSIAATGIDAAAPTVDGLRVFGRAGTPTEVLVDRPHTVTATVADDYALATWQLSWRLGAGPWTTFATGTFTGGCRVSSPIWATWHVPAGLPVDTLVDVRLVVSDVGGHASEAVTQVRTRANGEPAVTIERPAGGEAYPATTPARPSCVPVEAYVVAGAPVTSILVGFANADRTRKVMFIPIVPIPADGHVVTCLEALYAGDDLRVFVRVTDAGGSYHEYYAGPIVVDVPPALPPWGELVVDPSQPAPPLPAPGTIADTGYGGLWLVGGTAQLLRQDVSRVTQPPEATTTYDVTRLVLDTSSLTTTSATAWVDGLVETGPASATFGGFTSARQDDFTFQLELPTLASCVPDIGRPCDFQPRVRSVGAAGVGPWTSLATYGGLELGEGPFFSADHGVVRGPSGARFLSLGWEDGGVPRSDVYREGAGGWTRLAIQDPGIGRLVVARGQMRSLRARVDGTGWHLTTGVVSEATGVRGPETDVLNAPATTQLWHLAYDAGDDVLYVLAYDGAARTVQLARLDGAGWTRPPSVVLPASWRGAPVVRYIPQDAVAGGGLIHDWIDVYLADGAHRVQLAFAAGGAPDVDLAFDDPGDVRVSGRQLVALPDGGLLRAWTCTWNLEPRLCLQRAHPVQQSCWDAEPCTIDDWDAVAGACAPTLVACPSDGNACNGPEVCVAGVGTCATDGPMAPACNDGLWCNGVETCAITTGACSPGVAARPDDGIACTVDACDEAADLVTHLRRDDRCVAGPCTIATCDPTATGADPVTGCIERPAPVVPDGLACTVDQCDPTTGSAIHAIDPGSCVIGGACVAAGTVAPGNPCLLCAPSLSQVAWSPAPDDQVCSDGAFCTVGDRCAAGQCLGDARLCPPGAGGCQVPVCDEAADTCGVQQLADGASCSDGLDCNGSESCAGGACVVTPLPIDDGNPCTFDDCDEFAGVSHTPLTGTPCDADHDGCTVGDACANGTCVAGAAPDCSPLDGECRQGRCLSESATTFECVASTAPFEGAPCADDGDACTRDRCGQGVCTHEATCDAGLGDAGGDEPPRQGCACGAGRANTGAVPPLALCVGWLLLARRRRRTR